jgi:hypothetical protein
VIFWAYPVLISDLLDYSVVISWDSKRLRKYNVKMEQGIKTEYVIRCYRGKTR